MLSFSQFLTEQKKKPTKESGKISIKNTDSSMKLVTDPELLKKLGGINPKQAPGQDDEKEEDESSDSDSDDGDTGSISESVLEPSEKYDYYDGHKVIVDRNSGIIQRGRYKGKRVDQKKNKSFHEYLTGTSPQKKRDSAMAKAQAKANRSRESGTYFIHTQMKGVEDPDKNFHDYISPDKRSISKDENKSIYNYTTTHRKTSAYHMNKVLRGFETTKDIESNKKAANFISSAMRHNPIKHNIITHRKIGLNGIESIFGKDFTKMSQTNAKKMIGSVFVDYGFVSTSSNDSFNAPGDQYDDAWDCEIYVKKGSRVLSIRDISEYDNENELLIDRESYYKMVDVNMKKRQMKVQLIQL